MTAITLAFYQQTWQPQTRYPWATVGPGFPAPAPIPNTPWKPSVPWVGPLGEGLPNAKGIYIVEKGGRPLYVGKAMSFTHRFEGRARVLHEYALTSAPLPGYTLRLAQVQSPSPITNQLISLAEHWVIRYAFWRDFAIPPQQLQNLGATDSFQASATGLTINYNPAVAPLYFSDPTAAAVPEWRAWVPGANVGFEYNPGEWVFR